MKTAIITGAAGNLGKAVTRQFINDGYKVVAITLPGKEDSVFGDNVEAVPIDLSDESEVEKAFQEISQKHPQIDAALFLAGGYHYGGIEATDAATVEKMMTINFKTAFFLSKKIFQHMKDQGKGGRLVFVGAKPALEPKAGKDSFAYALSKSLMFRLSELYNAEGVSQGILSTVVAPSIIDTPPNREAMSDADFSKWVKPEEIAKVMAFVCSDDASAIRESVVKVYGQS